MLAARAPQAIIYLGNSRQYQTSKPFLGLNTRLEIRFKSTLIYLGNSLPIPNLWFKTNIRIEYQAWDPRFKSTLIYLGNSLPIPNLWFKTNIGIECQVWDRIPNMLVNVILACKSQTWNWIPYPDSKLQAKCTQFPYTSICLEESRSCQISLIYIWWLQALLS